MKGSKLCPQATPHTVSCTNYYMYNKKKNKRMQRQVSAPCGTPLQAFAPTMCVSLRVRVRADVLELQCMAPTPADCTVTPTFAQHYAYADRLLTSILVHGMDLNVVRTLVIFDDRAPQRAAEFCSSYPRACYGDQHWYWEATDLWRLTSLDLQDERNGSALSRIVHRLKCLLPKCPTSRSSVTKSDAPFTARVAKNAALFSSSLKKLLAVAHCGCTRAWVLDSESIAIRPFRFAAIFREYWSRGAPLYKQDGPCQRQSKAFQKSQSECRPSLTDSNARKLLGMPPLAPNATGSTWTFNDYWLWDAALLRAALAQSRAAHQAGSFVEAFVELPVEQ